MDSTRHFDELGFDCSPHPGGDLQVRAPRDGALLASLRMANSIDVQPALQHAQAAFAAWRLVPAPLRGELVRRLGEVLRHNRFRLGRLVSLESGKILAEGLGEVQEMIDICDFAVGLSRQLHGLTIVSERPAHRMMETWHPLGVCAVITAFNFPVAVWAWNAALALVCGNAVLWKPSEKTPLTALAVQSLFDEAVQAFALDHPGAAPRHLNQVIIGGADVGAAIAASPAATLVSATGSVRMGRAVAVAVAGRLGRSLLELGGNNAMIVAATADLELAARAITFSAVGTAGQRCTSLRRLFVHAAVHDVLVGRLQTIFASVAVGDPLADGTLVGPLIDGAAFEAMQAALAQARAEGGTVIGGERLYPDYAGAGAGPDADADAHADAVTNIANAADPGRDAYYVRPALVLMPRQSAVMHAETFAPILYIVAIDNLDQGIGLNNAVPQGLSSAIMTNDLREAELFMSAAGSDCGLANVNIGTSGAEIGGAFGGEKDTGGGRESGADAWKAYMRRATNTINYGSNLPLAQGVTFDVG